MHCYFNIYTHMIQNTAWYSEKKRERISNPRREARTLSLSLSFSNAPSIGLNVKSNRQSPLKKEREERRGPQNNDETSSDVGFLLSFLFCAINLLNRLP